MILFCLPYAGGSEAIYYKWKDYLSPSIQLIPIELKGRGKRYNETFYETLDEAINDIFKWIKERIMNDDYAIYGHSMGSILAYELYYKVISEKLRKPKHIFFFRV
ncbi:thioesterase II family protein [Clostridium hydrogenum]|uniref:thioesterase II family protein n=1 Tax=Clostridium hydrogenum TaxID=2855764 RepID=UPI0022A6B912|nr:thioesterase domain-containing protein [Clostridium hydrogenum]